MTRQDAGSLLPLLRSVVTELAQALQIPSIEEQILVAFVRLDVVDSVGSLDRNQRTTQAACRLSLQLMPAKSIPALGLV